jgi:hypothetical protein
VSSLASTLTSETTLISGGSLTAWVMEHVVVDVMLIITKTLVGEECGGGWDWGVGEGLSQRSFDTGIIPLLEMPAWRQVQFLRAAQTKTRAEQVSVLDFGAFFRCEHHSRSDKKGKWGGRCVSKHSQ